MPLPSLTSLLQDGSPFALLDDASGTETTSRLYYGWQESLTCLDPQDLPLWQAQVQSRLSTGQHILLLADYEWGLPLMGLTADAAPDTAPRLRAEVFTRCTLMSASAVAHWLKDVPTTASGLFAWQPQQGRDHFNTAIAAIHDAITRGDTYQVNHTFALEGLAHGEPAAVYARLRARQSAPYGALIRHPDSHWSLSLSPELFVRCSNGVAEACPMKGTAPAGDNPAQAAAALRGDAKNRAENLMIVDLLRNDLGGIARPGGVSVPSLFDVQHNGQVLGMTSSVRAELAPATDLAALLRAVFPCGSITGAPKRSTMAVIEQLEARATPPHRRGLYCGAIGWLEGGTTSDAMALCLSVPIRTLELQPRSDGLFHARFPVGAGITIDSVAEAEWDECLLKARFATAGMAGFELFETLRVEADGRTPHRAAHCQRLLRSARALGLTNDPLALDACLDAALAGLSRGTVWRLRLALQPDGQFSHRAEPLAPLPEGPVRVVLGDAPIAIPAPLLAHKTSLRGPYDAALAAAMADGAFDVLFFNPHDELTEGARSNVFVRLDGHWFTPPLHCGLLPGVMRAALLADPHWQARERVLTRHDLLSAEQIVLCNALRGPLPAVL